MSNIPSSRFGSRSSRGHVRRPRRPLPNWLVALFAIIGFAAVVLLVRVVINQINGDDVIDTVQSNRAWLRESWTQNPVTDAEIDVLVARLENNNITMIYVETGAWRADGQYRAHDYAEQFRAQMRAAARDIRVLPWIWVDPERYNSETSQTSVVSYVRDAIRQWGYDGVHLQGFEVFNNFDDDALYILLIRALEAVTGSRHVLSVTAPPDHAPANSSVPRGAGNPSISWTPQDKQRVALLADELVLLPFQGGLETVEDYESWVAYQVETYARNIDRLDVQTGLIIGLPVFPENLFHDPLIENATTTTNGALQGTRQAGEAGRRVVGAGLYWYGETNESDWVMFKDRWGR